MKKSKIIEKPTVAVVTKIRKDRVLNKTSPVASGSKTTEANRADDAMDTDEPSPSVPTPTPNGGSEREDERLIEYEELVEVEKTKGKGRASKKDAGKK